ncbi:hypothetical protein, partial [Bacillus thuringiensis]|uniref:hypothetical protein n=1 Tax=Bacillus thuringiensis TaxID=1428 RepID=UPI00320AF68C
FATPSLQKKLSFANPNEATSFRNGKSDLYWTSVEYLIDLSIDFVIPYRSPFYPQAFCYIQNTHSKMSLRKIGVILHSYRLDTYKISTCATPYGVTDGILITI